MDATQAFYSAPSYAYRGGSFPVFAGSRRQRGGSILGSLAKMVMPVLGAVGKAALNQAAGLAGDLVSDAQQGRSFRQSLKQRGLSRLGKTLRALPGRRPATRSTTLPARRIMSRKRPAVPSRRPLGKRPGAPLRKSSSRPLKQPRNF